MRRLGNIWRHASIVSLITICWLGMCGVAFAQQKQEPPGGSYVMPYILVLLVIALGLMSVLRPSRRRDRAKAESYDEIKFKAKEE